MNRKIIIMIVSLTLLVSIIIVLSVGVIEKSKPKYIDPTKLSLTDSTISKYFLKDKRKIYDNLFKKENETNQYEWLFNRKNKGKSYLDKNIALSYEYQDQYIKEESNNFNISVKGQGIKNLDGENDRIETSKSKAKVFSFIITSVNDKELFKVSLIRKDRQIKIEILEDSKTLVNGEICEIIFISSTASNLSLKINLNSNI